MNCKMCIVGHMKSISHMYESARFPCNVQLTGALYIKTYLEVTSKHLVRIK